VLAADLDIYCRTKLARLKVPKEFHLLDSLPRTSIGKVQKGQLRTQARELRATATVMSEGNPA